MQNVLEQYKLYKQYQSIISEAERFFQTTTVFENFKSQAYTAYTQGNLDDFQFTIDALITLEQSQNSPLYEVEVERLVNSPQFDAFADLLSTISSPHQTLEESLEVSSSVATAVNESLPIGQEQTLLSSAEYTPEEIDIIFPKSNKIVLDTTSHAGQAEKLLSGDGFITNPQAFTTNKLEDERQANFEEELSSTQNEQQAQDLVDKYTPASFSPDITQPDSQISTTMQSEYSGQLDATFIMEQTADIANTIKEEMFKMYAIFEKENYIEMEKNENEQEE